MALDFGRNVTTWWRIRNDGREEVVQYCKSQTGPGCNQFIDVITRKTATPTSKVRVYPNGTLTFEKLTGNDCDVTYYSPEMRSRRISKVGVTWGLPTKQIYLACKGH
ncbi:hypothetical protein Aduo_006501 [Ancylostoma duodenale]